MEKIIKMNTLIVYASKYGCVERCAGIIKKELNNQADIVNLRDRKKFDLSGYEKVIIGGSIYIGKIRKEVTEFCANNINELKKKRLGLFICGMQENAFEAELNQNFPQELLNIAAAKEYLGGEFLLDKMGFMDRLIVKKVSKITTNISKISEERIHNLVCSIK
jgi:menaquinone-dependent protoporphyrinogen oxidase